MEPKASSLGNIIIRSHWCPKDLKSIINLHARLYAQEYGLDKSLAEYVAASLIQFKNSFNPERDRLWLAEKGRSIIGSIGIVDQREGMAQLRWFLVHPNYRGRGLGRNLLQKALDFCRQVPYSLIYLWTFSELKVAAHLYQSLGFQIKERITHQIWGRILTEEKYELLL
ncbi:MAG: GNAT family N-acetyltransferase [Thermodesulfobacteriota bacterium]